MKIKLTNTEPLTFVKRAYKLAYDACGGPSGMGWLQARADVKEEDVFRNVCTRYPGPREDATQSGDFYGDYVFGRMMKLSIRVKADVVEIPRDEFDIDYNGFAGKYPTAEDLIAATLVALGDKANAFEIVS